MASSSTSEEGAWAFAGPRFDVKAWVNQRLARADAAGPSAGAAGGGGGGDESPADAREERIGALLLRLQLLSTEMNGALEAASSDLLRAFPRTMREIKRVHTEALHLRASLSDILQEVSDVRARAPLALASLHPRQGRADTAVFISLVCCSGCPPVFALV